MPSYTRYRARGGGAPPATAPGLARPSARNLQSICTVSFDSTSLTPTSHPGRKSRQTVKPSMSQSNSNTRKRIRRSNQDADDTSDEEYHTEDEDTSEEDSHQNDLDPDIQLQLQPTCSSTNIQPTDDDEEVEDDDLMRRLDNQFQPIPGPTNRRASNRIERQGLARTTGPNQQEQAPTDGEQVLILPTLNNYKSKLDKWPPHRIAVHERSQIKKGTAVPPKILKEAQAICKLYKHQKAMLALMGNISKFTLEKALGELGGRRKTGGYQLWKRYSKEIDNHPMPPKGVKGILAKRNRDLGKIWTALPDEQHELFHPSIFYRLSGLTPPPNENSDDEEEDEDVFPLNATELADAQVLYDEVVNKAKVAKDFAKAAAGIPQGPSLPDYNHQSLKCIERLHTQLENESNNMNFSYYLLACSTYASSESSNAAPGWCREFTTHEEMALYVNKKSNFATVFGARAQGLLVSEVVAQTIGGNVMLSSEKARKTDPGDKVKGDLALLLRAMFSALTGKEQGFPRCPDPESLLLDTYNIKVVQMPGSTLPKDVLKLGFNGMNSRRSLWLSDVQKNLFRLEKVTPNSDVADSDTRGNQLNEDLDFQVTMTQDNDNDLEHNMMEAFEEEEWNGFGDIDMDE
ncbi:uncharacterized protein MELLADRAFT_84179 [Melampsora larici-populina 98AG31]|uniref:Uncharacterized protein n=1 Tax=Melampsora larici-populina (strain 98AG31 / pathotype 3-4-7) TaxID=747676 RepID=F4SBT8_MELLP|nr:uncharacterized protein MELLADRAFT_84179 [Melampsora larici-populina 98AG31]EGF97895.1 hypothetical protein MELLADRAFT_84179 [Melampsora larici-populina 98AG31]